LKDNKILTIQKFAKQKFSFNFFNFLFNKLNYLFLSLILYLWLFAFQSNLSFFYKMENQDLVIVPSKFEKPFPYTFFLYAHFVKENFLSILIMFTSKVVFKSMKHILEFVVKLFHLLLIEKKKKLFLLKPQVLKFLFNIHLFNFIFRKKI
jgi:hypothetical protein